MSEESKEKCKLVVAGPDHTKTQAHTQQSEEKRQIVVVGPANKNTLKAMGELLAQQGFEVSEAFTGSDISALSGDDKLIDALMDGPLIYDEITSEMDGPRKKKKVEPWRMKKGRFKGDFPRYR